MDDDDLPGRLLVQRALEDMASAQQLTQAILTWSVERYAEAMDYQADCLEQWWSALGTLHGEAPAARTQTPPRRNVR